MDHSSPLPPLDGLQAVLAAWRSGSFSAAAAELGITHGAVSRRIAGVESWAGASLFERHGRGVRLTVEGQRLVVVVEQGLDLIAGGASAWRTRRQPDMVRVGVVASFARLWLLPNLEAIEGSPPDLRIDCEIDHRYSPAGQVDVAIRYGLGGWRDWAETPLFAETLVPVAAPAIARDLGPAAAAADMLRHPLIHDSHPEPWRLWLRSQGVPYRLRTQDRRFPAFDLVMHAAAAGRGVALLRRPYGDAFLANGSLVPVSEAAIANPSRFHALTQPGAMREPVRRLLDRLVALAG